MRCRRFVILLAFAAAASAGLLVYSLTVACYGDEGFHLLAARLIRAGRRPYVDFFYQHPPLYPYLNAFWMGIFGDGWRSVHALSSLLASGGILLAAFCVFSRLTDPLWQLPAAIAAALLMASQPLVIQFGGIGQPYGLCLFASMAAFWLAASAAAHPRRACFAAGFCAGAAAGSSLLAVPVGGVLFVWLLRDAGKGKRMASGALFLAGAMVCFLPLLYWVWQAPEQTFFDVVKYHAFYRSSAPASDLRRDFEVLKGWLDSPQAVLRALLAAVSLLYLGGRPDAPMRREAYLCAWLAGALAVWVAVAHPALPQYFILLAPFVSILDALGLYAIGSRLWAPEHAAWPASLCLCLLAAALAKPVYDGRRGQGYRWSDWERVAQEVNRVTPESGLLWAPDIIYFAARRLPPAGLENSNSLALRLPPALSSRLHIIPEAEADQWVANGRFDTVCACVGMRVSANPDPPLGHGLPGPYKNQLQIQDCYIFWGSSRGAGRPGAEQPWPGSPASNRFDIYWQHAGFRVPPLQDQPEARRAR
ncbi:MAG TPA: glycosyltransferase family 39 protein [Bryobacterales bacterium]|jgi:4-amino-4-deoxy-L-arabinose transferase-like glycosyltransferase|nr:glycosyltransferase family 39 protein [Bryobacterales bacterium]